MIWCVEDDASIRDIEVYALQSTGYEARGFEDGTSFLKEVKNQKPELVVLDVMLPGIDGITLLQKLKEDPEKRKMNILLFCATGKIGSQFLKFRLEEEFREYINEIDEKLESIM